MAESELFNQIKKLRTEQVNPATVNIDSVSTIEILELINNEDAKVHLAVKEELETIAEAVELIVNSFKKGGRLIYAGAGTSGRLGVVDASECPPTFGVPPYMVQGIIAGGKEAVFKSQEGAEDNKEAGEKSIMDLNVNQNDTVCGIAASGRTPYVISAVNKAKDCGASTIFISTASKEDIRYFGIHADVVIAPNVGPEAITGSTRMKSGTAQKMILNMLTTASMVKMGKTYGNIMVDLQFSNAKLKERAKRIIMDITDVDYDTAEDYIILSDGNVKTALVMILTGKDKNSVNNLLEKFDGKISNILEFLKSGFIKPQSIKN